jgi:hypothetical protein
MAKIFAVFEKARQCEQVTRICRKRRTITSGTFKPNIDIAHDNSSAQSLCGRKEHTLSLILHPVSQSANALPHPTFGRPLPENKYHSLYEVRFWSSVRHVRQVAMSIVGCKHPSGQATCNIMLQSLPQLHNVLPADRPNASCSTQPAQPAPSKKDEKPSLAVRTSERSLCDDRMGVSSA